MDSLQFKDVQEEIYYWKYRYYESDQKNQQLKACHTYNTKDEEQDESSPVKKARIEDDENSMDPLKLPEPCTRIIMENLTAKELLTATEVSKYWKEFIESRRFLMNRAMDKIIVKPTIEDFSLPLIYALFDDRKAKRPYKHMKGSLTLICLFENNILKIINPVIYFASTLETLRTRNDNFGLEHYRQCFNSQISNLPKLQKIILDRWICNFLEEFSFPVLTHLRFDSISHEIYDLLKMLCKCPKLKILITQASLHDSSKIVPTFFVDPQSPKIECISVAEYSPNFLRAYQDLLVKLEIKTFCFDQMPWLLHDLKILKSLTIGSLLIEKYKDENLKRNESVEQLKICFEEDYYDPEDLVQDFYNALKILLLAIPSLSELTVSNYLNGDTLKFLASNMRHLKRLICYEYNEELLTAYEEIKNNPRQYINSSFEFVADPNIDFNEIQKEF